MRRPAAFTTEMNTSADPLALQVEDLRKNFSMGPDSVPVLDGVNLRLAGGAFEVVMGPSGSGKSTLLHLLAGLLTADEGRIRVAGKDIVGLKDDIMTRFRRRHIGLIFQDFNLVPTLTAEENILLPLMLDRRSPEPGRVDDLLGMLHLGTRRRHRPAKLSGGERQRVAIARALVSGPALVLADEPTGNLDALAGRGFCALLRETNRRTGCTILMVSHDPVVAATADKAHLLCDGRIVESFETRHDSSRVSSRYLATMQAVAATSNHD